MGGRGSGQYYRGSTRTTCEEVKRIDIRYLRKHGLLQPNRVGSLSWNIGGEPTGSIKYVMLENEMILDFKARGYWDEDWESVEQRIWFDSTPCHYGGLRKWFICPQCDTRVAVLYHVNQLFLCRHCYNLPYASQGEDHTDRMQRRVDKIVRKFGPESLEDDFYYKPKGMHWKTFERLISTENRLQEAIERGLLFKFRHWL